MHHTHIDVRPDPVTDLPKDAERYLSKKACENEVLNKTLIDIRQKINGWCTTTIHVFMTTTLLSSHALNDPECSCAVPALVTAMMTVFATAMARISSLDYIETTNERGQLLNEAHVFLEERMAGDLVFRQAMAERGVEYPQV